MKFSARMRYEKEDYEAVACLSGKVLNRGRTLGTRVMFLIGAVLFIVLAAAVALSKMSAGMPMCVLCILVAIFFFGMSVFFYSYQAWMLRRRQPVDVGETTYIFREDSLRMENVLDDEDYAYDRFKAVLESEEHFFLMLNEKNALVLPKRSMVVGTPRGLKEFLEKKLGKPVQNVEL